MESLKFEWDENKNSINKSKHNISNAAKILVVCHCYRASDTVIRIISARKATKAETSQYYDF